MVEIRIEKFGGMPAMTAEERLVRKRAHARLRYATHKKRTDYNVKVAQVRRADSIFRTLPAPELVPPESNYIKERY